MCSISSRKWDMWWNLQSVNNPRAAQKARLGLEKSTATQQQSLSSASYDNKALSWTFSHASMHELASFPQAWARSCECPSLEHACLSTNYYFE